MLDWIVVGGGIGGITTAALLTQKSPNGLLLEKLPYLGGCSGTYTTRQGKYNVGATTIIGYEPGLPLHDLCQQLDITLGLTPIDPAMEVDFGHLKITRWQNLERFIQNLNSVFPHPSHERFWKEVHAICESFWKNHEFYYSKASVQDMFRTGLSLLSPLRRFGSHLFDRAETIIRSHYAYLDEPYALFLDEQIRIVAQAGMKEVNFLTAALALGYTFRQNHYAPGGMGTVMDQLATKISAIHPNEAATRIISEGASIRVETKKAAYSAKKLYLNTSLFDSSHLFDTDSPLHRDLQKQSSGFQQVGAFTLYFQVKSDKPLPHHVQILLPEPLPHTQSRSFFVSISDLNDTDMAPPGHRSVTVSTHTPLEPWKNLDKEIYRQRKEAVTDAILQHLSKHLPELTDPLHLQSGTPATFERYINRSSVGGIPLKREYFRLNYPAPDTSDSRIWRVGDTVFPGQGWPGVIMGSQNAIHASHR